jgi:hypothetical protein
MGTPGRCAAPVYRPPGPGQAQLRTHDVPVADAHRPGLARHVAAAGIRVVEVDRPARQDRRRTGGDRQASHALRRIVITRMGSHPLGKSKSQPGLQSAPGAESERA